MPALCLIQTAHFVFSSTRLGRATSNKLETVSLFSENLYWWLFYMWKLYTIFYIPFFSLFSSGQKHCIESIRECLSYTICSLKILNPILRLFSFWITVAKKRRIHSLLRDPKSISHPTIVPSLLINFQLRRWFLFSVERETSGKSTDADSSKRHNTIYLKFPPSFYTAKVLNLQLIPHTSWTAKCLNFSIPLYETYKNLPTSSLHI
jgi:hypothetical protein